MGQVQDLAARSQGHQTPLRSGLLRQHLLSCEIPCAENNPFTVPVTLGGGWEEEEAVQGGQTLAVDTGRHSHSPTRPLSEEPCCGRGRAAFYSNALNFSCFQVLSFCPVSFVSGMRSQLEHGGSLISELQWRQGRLCPLLAPAPTQSFYPTTWHAPFQRSF